MILYLILVPRELYLVVNLFQGQLVSDVYLLKFSKMWLILYLSRLAVK